MDLALGQSGRRSIVSGALLLDRTRCLAGLGDNGQTKIFAVSVQANSRRMRLGKMGTGRLTRNAESDREEEYGN